MAPRAGHLACTLLRRARDVRLENRARPRAGETLGAAPSQRHPVVTQRHVPGMSARNARGDAFRAQLAPPDAPHSIDRRAESVWTLLVLDSNAPRSETEVNVSIHRIIQRSLMTALLLSFTGVASAHVFPKPQTKAERAVERERACASAGVVHRRFVRFGRPAEHSPATVAKAKARRTVAWTRFGPAPPATEVVCPPRNVATLCR